MCLVAVMDWNGMGPTRSRGSFSRSVGRWNGHHLVPTDRIFGPDPEPGETSKLGGRRRTGLFPRAPAALSSLVQAPLPRLSPPSIYATALSPPLVCAAGPRRLVHLRSTTSLSSKAHARQASGCEKILKLGNSGDARRESRAAMLDLGAIH